MVSREQAHAHGLSDASLRRLRRDGWWQRLEAGLYFTGSDEVTWLGLAWGGVLLGGDEARLGAEAAAKLHGLIASAPAVITVLVPHGSPRAPRGPWQFVQERDGLRRRSRGAPPRLDVEDTVLDLADACDEATAVDVVTRAVQERLTVPDRLRRRLELRPRHRHRRLLGSVLADVEEGAQSPLELRYLVDVERPHGLPPGRRQHRSRGTFRDVYYEEFGAIVELDGRAGHEGSGRLRDMRRDNRSTLAGEPTLRYGWWDVVDQPCLVAAQVATLLASRGWSGVMVHCPKCARHR